MDIKEQAHKYLIDKGCLSVGQTYTAFQVEEMLVEFAQDQVKSFYQPGVMKSVCGKPCDELRGACDKCKKEYYKWEES